MFNKYRRLHPGLAVTLVLVLSVAFSIIVHSALIDGVGLVATILWFAGFLGVLAALAFSVDNRAPKEGFLTDDPAEVAVLAGTDAETDEAAETVAKLRRDLGRSRVRADALQGRISAQASTVLRAERLTGRSALRVEQLTEALVSAGIAVPADEAE